MADAPTAEVTCVLDARAELGECPVWAVEEQALYWIDIRAAALHRLDPASGATRTWPMPSRIGAFGPRASGGAVGALEDGFHRLALGTGRRASAAGRGRAPGTRCNDGRVAPDGRFFAGTMDEEMLSRPIATLFRRDPDLSLHPVVENLIVSNGLAWTADGRTMFHSDSKGPVVWAYDYDPGSGEVANRREVARPTKEIGRPDGGAADEQGYYWS